MPIDAEIEAAVVAMRAVRVKGAKLHEEVCWRMPGRLYKRQGEQGRKIFVGVPGLITNRRQLLNRS